MSLFAILSIAVILAMDSFTVSIASGISIKKIRLTEALKIAFAFGLFQGVMPIIGWKAGVDMASLISEFDHWIAFILLSGIGAKMIYESLQKKTELKIKNHIGNMALLGLAVATSIDALAVGLSFAFLDVKILNSAIIIGTVTFSLSLIGVYIGKRTGHFFEQRIETIAGIILIGIGAKILIEHLFF